MAVAYGGGPNLMVGRFGSWLHRLNLEYSTLSCLRSILNVGHTTRNSILYVFTGKPPLSVYITKSVPQFVESWSKGNQLVAKVARHTLQLDLYSSQTNWLWWLWSCLQELLLIGTSYVEIYAIGYRLTLGKQPGWGAHRGQNCSNNLQNLLCSPTHCS